MSLLPRSSVIVSLRQTFGKLPFFFARSVLGSEYFIRSLWNVTSSWYTHTHAYTHPFLSHSPSHPPHPVSFLRFGVPFTHAHTDAHTHTHTHVHADAHTQKEDRGDKVCYTMLGRRYFFSIQLSSIKCTKVSKVIFWQWMYSVIDSTSKSKVHLCCACLYVVGPAHY